MALRLKAKDVEIEMDGEGFSDMVRRALEVFLASHGGDDHGATTDSEAQITEEQWKAFLADRTDLQLDVINKLRARGGEITLRELVSVTNGHGRKLGGVVGSLNRLSQRLWGILMIQPRQRVHHPDGTTEYGYEFAPLVPWRVE